MRRGLLIAVALLAGWGALSSWRHRSASHSPGILAAAAPEQVDLDDGASLQRGDITLKTRAHYVVTARVLSREDYRFDAGARLAPTDLALGWGRMSDSGMLDRIAISQSGRFYHWQANELPMPRREIETSSANTHIVPADAGVRHQLDRVRVGQVVHLEGFLVDASRGDGWQWHTSMTRDDTGDGACELLYVESLAIAP